MFAEVIPQIRTIPSLGIFDYEIPDNISVKIGDLVKINFRNSEKTAVVYKIKKYSPYQNIKPIISKIKGINLSARQMKTMDLLSKKYNISLALALKTVLPEIPKKNNAIKQEKKQELPFLTQNINKNRIDDIKKIIKQATKIKGHVVLHYNNTNEKNAFIIGILNKIPKTKQLLIIVPERRDINYIAPLFTKLKPAIIHSGLNKNERWNIWLDIKNNKTKIIIGTKAAIFIPPENLGLIIIDNEEDKSHFNYEQNPKYDVFTVAKELNTKIVLTSQAPSIAASYQYPVIQLLNEKNEIKIIDLGREKEKGNYTYFSEQLLDLLGNHNKSLLLFNRKGLAKWLVCQNCHEIMPYATTTYCPSCRGLNFKKISFGTTKLKNDLIKIFPNKKIIEVTKDSQQITNDYDIIIGTEYALRFVNLSKLDLIGIISIDHQLAMPDYLASEKVWQLIVKVANLRKKTVLQTNSPQNLIIKSASIQDYQSFLKRELALRKQYHYTPFDK